VVDSSVMYNGVSNDGDFLFTGAAVVVVVAAVCRRCC